MLYERLVCDFLHKRKGAGSEGVYRMPWTYQGIKLLYSGRGELSSQACMLHMYGFFGWRELAGDLHCFQLVSTAGTI